MNLFGDQLRKLRTQKRITQKQLAEKFKISESAVGMYERNEREPAFQLVRSLADYFDVSTDFLLAPKKSKKKTDIKKLLQNEEPTYNGKKLTEEQTKMFIDIFGAILNQEGKKD